jgi:hypothetical protein
MWHHGTARRACPAALVDAFTHWATPDRAHGGGRSVRFRTSFPTRRPGRRGSVAGGRGTAVCKPLPRSAVAGRGWPSSSGGTRYRSGRCPWRGVHETQQHAADQHQNGWGDGRAGHTVGRCAELIRWRREEIGRGHVRSDAKIRVRSRAGSPRRRPSLRATAPRLGSHPYLDMR